MPEHTYQGPPSCRKLAKHEVFPQVSHDDIARFDFLSQVNHFLANTCVPAVKKSYDSRVSPAFEQAHGRLPKNRHEVRAAMKTDSFYQIWSALRRNTMEMRQQVGRSVVFSQLDSLIGRVARLNENSDALKLDPSVKAPSYLSAVDTHCMPGSYFAEVSEGDISAAANYDVGIFCTTGGLLGKLSDGGGQAIVNWLQQDYPDFKPTRILDIGCSLGHNTLPIAQAFPNAKVVALDAATPMLRYGHARAKALGVHNVEFVQANAESLGFENNSFDFIMTSMFWHETSSEAMPAILKEIFRLLDQGGLTLHLEQPQYQNMPIFEQFMRDWDCYNNNEPFWSAMHDLDLAQSLSAAGFEPEAYFETKLEAIFETDLFPQMAEANQEDYGRKAAWTAFGAFKQNEN